MAPSKKSQEEIRRKKKECERRRREKIKANPKLHEQTKAKERERYRKRKEEGKIVPVEQMSERKQRKQRKEWRKRQKICRENRKCNERLLSRLREDSLTSNDSENQPSAIPIQSPSILSQLPPSQGNLSPSLLENFWPRRHDSNSGSSTASYQKKAGLKAAKRNKYIIQKKLKLQEKTIANLKKKVNALRMKT